MATATSKSPSGHHPWPTRSLDGAPPQARTATTLGQTRTPQDAPANPLGRPHRRLGPALPGAVAATLALSVAVELLGRVDVAPLPHVALTWVVLSLPLLYLANRGPTRPAGRAPRHDVEPTEQTANTRQHFEELLRTEKALTVVYQPIVDLQRGDVVGHEALARFRGGRPPDVWFEQAHAVGLGVELELLAVSRAIEGSDDQGFLSINVSPVALASPAFRNLLRHHRTPERLVVEVTENVMIEDYTTITVALQAIRALGVGIAVDDAGGGFASLRHVLALAPDLIKLDRSLIQGLDRDPNRHSLAHALQAFATSTGAHLVAEGIEREAELAACQDLGIRYGQGYLLGEPRPPNPKTPSEPTLLSRPRSLPWAKNQANWAGTT